jgi:RsiW-degrading membrane proteinase PrsW (M82 family)
MMALTLLLLAIAPGFFILWYVYSKDKYEKEPKGLIIVTFLLGAVMVFPAGFLEMGLERVIGIPMEGNFLGAFIGAFLVVAPIEEVCKYLSVRIKAFRSPDFDSVMDGIVYSVSGAIGFATLENVFYVMGGGIGVGLLRAFLSVPGHAMEGAILGYYLGMRKMNPESKEKFVLAGLLMAILFHGAYDFVLFTQTPLGLLIVPIIVWLYFLFRKRIYVALKGSSFRGVRDEELFQKVAKRLTPAGILKVIFGLFFLICSVSIVGVFIEQSARGIVWDDTDYLFLTAFTVVPTLAGIVLIALSRKNIIKK